MTTSTLTLTDFLLARIAEDEALAEDVYRHNDPDAVGEWTQIAPRVLVECEAKRRIISTLWTYEHTIEGEWGKSRSREQMAAEGINPDGLADLALPYADHPDYDESWRP